MKVIAGGLLVLATMGVASTAFAADGKAALVASVTKGKNAMPPKGGNAALSDADIAAAVDYITAAAK